MLLNLCLEQIDLKCIMLIVETGFNMWIREKSKNQKVIVPANFSNIPLFETWEQNISLTCISGTTLIGILLNPWFFFIIKSIVYMHKL